MALAEGALAPDLMVRIEAHARVCPQCSELLAVALQTGLNRRAAAGAGDAAAATLTLQPEAAGGAISRGTKVGRYTILSLVGSGGMGEVYAAYDPELDRKIALKFLRSNGARTPTRGQARLLREAKALARISHRNVVAVHDAGTFDGRVFVAMEFVEGTTLRQWLAERPRTRDEILPVFLEAARGLSAAHAAGLVHRDFKPGNVMIAEDGSVRVTDFGLARAFSEDGPDADAGEPTTSDPASLDATLTVTGQLLGTPRYMAPEQFKAAAVDARTDQFSFCVALYEALYREPPFGDGGLPALSAAVLAGRVRPAAPKNNVPAWLRVVLLRGLNVSADARWPSMRELVAALTATPAKRRRRWAAITGASILVALCVVYLTRGSNRSASLCKGGPARLEGVWAPVGPTGAPDRRREAIRRSFLASGAPNASEVWERVPALLDRYAARWLAMFQDACLATHAGGAQPGAVLDLRMSCLEDRRTALVALTDVFVTADRGVVAKAVDAVNELPEIDRCGDVAALQAPSEPPRDEKTRAVVADLRKRIAVVKAMKATAKIKEALPLELAIVNEARASRYLPVLAEALALGALDANGIEGLGVRPRLEEAIWTAIVVRRDDLAALAAVMRMSSEMYSPEVSASEYWRQLASALLARMDGKQDRLRSWLIHGHALLERRQNKLSEALALIREAVAMKERILPKGHPDTATSRNTEAEILHLMGREEEALELNAQVLSTFIAAYGPASGEAAYIFSNRGDYLMALARPAEALAQYRVGLTRWEPHIGHDNPFLAYPLTGMGRALVALGRPKEAIPPLERALALRDPKESDPTDVAETQFGLAQALRDAGANARRARSLATASRDAYRHAGREKEARAVDEWLSR